MQQQKLFADLDQQRAGAPFAPVAERDAAIERSRVNADPEWFARALRAVREVCERQAEFTTDQVWQKLPPTKEHRVMGAVMRQAEIDGLCVPTDRVKNSGRKVNHSRPLRVWRSLLRRAG